jgi:hypothetical protein
VGDGYLVSADRHPGSYRGARHVEQGEGGTLGSLGTDQKCSTYNISYGWQEADCMYAFPC